VTNVNKKRQKKSIGYNHSLNTQKCAVHAEVDAFRNINLKSVRNQTLILLVIRTNKSKELCSSKPCSNCIKYMKKITLKYKFTLKHIYYSTREKTIVKTTLEQLDAEEDKHVSLSEHNRQMKT